jgi:DNA-directed RNA polymerase specialized sigma24 family protein
LTGADETVSSARPATPVPVSPDLLHHAESQLAPNARQPDPAERRRRIAADTAVVRALRTEGFKGPRTDLLLQKLAAYGWPVMLHWVSSGEIFLRCASYGRPVPRPAAGFSWTGDDHAELATETILKAVPFFRQHALRQEKWDARRGASLTTYFMGACISCFPQAYRGWWRQQADLQVLARSESEADALAHVPDPRHADPEHIAVLRDHAARVLAQIEDPVLIAALALRAMGYTESEAAKAVGLTPKALERRTSRQRAKLRRLEQEPETDARHAKGGE